MSPLPQSPPVAGSPPPEPSVPAWMTAPPRFEVTLTNAINGESVTSDHGTRQEAETAARDWPFNNTRFEIAEYVDVPDAVLDERLALLDTGDTVVGAYAGIVEEYAEVTGRRSSWRSGRQGGRRHLRILLDTTKGPRREAYDR